MWETCSQWPFSSLMTKIHICIVKSSMDIFRLSFNQQSFCSLLKLHCYSFRPFIPISTVKVVKSWIHFLFLFSMLLSLTFNNTVLHVPGFWSLYAFWNQFHSFHSVVAYIPEFDSASFSQRLVQWIHFAVQVHTQSFQAFTDDRGTSSVPLFKALCIFFSLKLKALNRKSFKQLDHSSPTAMWWL